MGTRSLTHIKDESGITLLTFYRQMDGYPTGHGQELADFINRFTLVNGMGLNETPKKIANGMGCLAAQILAYFKDQHGVGGIYVQRPDAEDCGEEYTYIVSPAPGLNVYAPPQIGPYLNLTCLDYQGTVLYDAPPSAFDGVKIEKEAYSEV